VVEGGWDAALVAEDLVSAPVGMLEREGELHALRALLDDARARRGRLLVVEAPPGLGKSTLLSVAAAVAAGGGLLVLGVSWSESSVGGWRSGPGLLELQLHRIGDLIHRGRRS
jgi:hypothetical protein